MPRNEKAAEEYDRAKRIVLFRYQLVARRLDPPTPAPTYLVGFLDDDSRLLAHGEFYWAEDVYALELCFQKAIPRRGAPLAVYVERGLIFQSRLFRYACAELGVEHISATAYHPAGKGKIERDWKSVDEGCLLELAHAPVSTLEELNRRFWAWVEEVYQVRVHSETGQTPLQRWAAQNQARPFNPDRVAEVFLWRTWRQADATAVIRFEGNRGIFRSKAHQEVGRRLVHVAEHRRNAWSYSNNYSVLESLHQ